MTVAADRAQKLMADINAMYKTPVVSMASDKKHVVQYLPTGLLPFDILLPGGLPRGRMLEIFGPPSSLKSYFLLCAIAAVQREGGIAALLDTESTFDPDWAENIGVDLDALIVPEVETGERAFDIAQALVANEVDLLGFDSIAAAQPQTYDENPLENSKIQPGRHASLFSLGLRKVTSKNRKTSIIFTNQTRMSIGVTFGNPEVTPGGKAPAFYASLRMKVAPAGKIHEDVQTWDGSKYVTGKKQIAQTFRAEMVKSKLSKPFETIIFDWSMKQGQIDMPKFLIAQGLELGILSYSGQMWKFNDMQVRGRENFINAIAEDKKKMGELEWAIRKHHKLPGTPPPRSSTRSVVVPSSPRRKKVVRRNPAS